MQIHYWDWHVRYTVVILKEGNLPHPWCPLCNMLVLWWSLNRLHLCTAQCKMGLERKQWRLSEEEERAVTSRAFGTYGRPLEMVISFRYLGRLILATDGNWLTVFRNLEKARAA